MSDRQIGVLVFALTWLSLMVSGSVGMLFASLALYLGISQLEVGLLGFFTGVVCLISIVLLLLWSSGKMEEELEQIEAIGEVTVEED